MVFCLETGNQTMQYKNNGQDIMNKWIGWVTDSQGYMVFFVPPTTQPWAKRKVHGFFTENHKEATYINVGYALRTVLHSRNIDDDWFRKLLAGDKQKLQELLEMGLNMGIVGQTPI